MPIKDTPRGKIVLLSYSSYSLYKQCPKRYHREKILREKIPDFDTSFTIPGTVTHKATEIYLETGNDQVFDPRVIEGGVIKHSKEEGVDLVKAYGSIEKCADFTKTCAENMYKFLIGRNIRSKKFIYEKWFGTWEEPLMLTENVGILGAPDLIEINDNGSAILYDYKATWSDKNLNREQLLIYCIASELKFKTPIAMSSFFLIPRNMHRYFRFTDEDKQWMINTLQEAALNILSGNFPTTPNDKCERCPYFNDCPDRQLPKANVNIPVPPKSTFGGIDTNSFSL